MERSSIKTGVSPSERPVLLFAHRGGEGRWPSNTLLGFEQSLKLGADVLELDIHRTADNVLVVRHDPVVDTTTNGQGRICDLSLADIKKLDAGYTWSADGGASFPFRGLGVTIPTLAEVIRAFPNARLNIDIKPEDPPVVHNFCKMLNEYNLLAQVTVGSFHDRQLELFRQVCPAIATAAGVSETRRFLVLSRLFLDRFFRSPARAFQVPEYAGRLRLVTPRFIRRAHARGLQVHIWTVNEVPDMQRLIAWGVDGLMTDYPDRLAEVLAGTSASVSSFIR